MRTKCKLSLTIERETYEALEKAARSANIPKSQIAQSAFDLWLKKENEALMAEGYEEMWKEDREFAALTFEAQREVLP
jgi:hypothetical protein